MTTLNSTSTFGMISNYQDTWSIFRLPSTFENNIHQHDELSEIDFNHLYEVTSCYVWETIFKLRLLFYMVWPSETMFASLEEVPRYVTEVS